MDIFSLKEKRGKRTELWGVPRLFRGSGYRSLKEASSWRNGEGKKGTTLHKTTEELMHSFHRRYFTEHLLLAIHRARQWGLGGE